MDTDKSLDDKKHALRMARRIEDYWHHRGRRGVRVWVDKVIVNEGQPTENMFYQIRSNLRLRATAETA